MSGFKVIKTIPGDAHYNLFEGLPANLYELSSMRFQLGNDPVSTYLEACYVLLSDDEPVGRYAFYENPGLKYKEERAACIGSYECVDDLKTSENLLLHAKTLAQSKGYAWLVGPMEGSTWNNYRFSKHNQHRNFFMEPYHHVYYNQQFLHAGFEEIAEYYSNRDQTLYFDRDELDKFEKRYLELGAVFRKLNMKELNNDLAKIAQLSLEGFAGNFLYTPISVDAFVAKYERLRDFFNPDLVLIVEDKQGIMEAFVFAIRDYMDPLGETVIVKSMVRRKSSPFRGVGSYLAGKIVQMASEMGFKSVIHALMIRDNASMQISKKYTGDVYKSYALYGLKL